MVEIRPFEGTPDELSAFIVGAWKASYGGSIAVPNWTADYFQWQLRFHEPESRRRVVAAFVDNRLAGVLLFCPYRFRLRGEELGGAHASWLSVSPDFRRRGVGSALHQGAAEACGELGLDFQLGYIFLGSRKSVGPKFWLRRRRTDQSTGPRVGFWARVLDARRAARWNVDRLERVLTRIAGSFVPDPVPRADEATTYREFQAGDVDDCLKLLSEENKDLELQLVWDRELLTHHCGGFGRCLIAESDGQVRGFISFHTLVFSGHTDERVGILDIVCARSLPGRQRRGLLNSVLSQLQREGAVVALKLRTGDYPSGFFTAWGWVPRPGDSKMLFSWCGEPRSVARVRPCHVLWR